MTPQVVHDGRCPSLRPSQLEGDYQLALEVYRITKEYPEEEIFGLFPRCEKVRFLSPVISPRDIGKNIGGNISNFFT